MKNNTTKFLLKKKYNNKKGIIKIQSSFNNTIVTLTDTLGKTIFWYSGGTSGFKGSKKGTPYAAQSAAFNVVNKAKNCGIKQVEVFVRGSGLGRDVSLRTFFFNGLNLCFVYDITKFPHNGCRPPKIRHA
uniref:Ribosomal protein S11 n=1 Tax=Epipogium roseum TaxID=556037 RepID=A0A0B4N659_9ASPA|nr:ribosomal protein S11 [Epipogium roseum]AII78966.1 ribosomal protein S11 [Epipogium roseum]AIS35801.1 ribosomal protein S11 [Epipogium roseum]